MRLQRSFFEQNTVEVAQKLLGKYLVFGEHKGKIVETEAYREDDPASHSFNGITKRNKVMFGPPGFSYIYFIYGMYHCFNVVTEESGKGCGVLIRAIKINEELINGPGKLCKAFGLTRKHNQIDLCCHPLLYIENRNNKAYDFETMSRIGIKKGVELPWRFVLV